MSGLDSVQGAGGTCGTVRRRLHHCHQHLDAVQALTADKLEADDQGKIGLCERSPNPNACNGAESIAMVADTDAP